MNMYDIDIHVIIPVFILGLFLISVLVYILDGKKQGKKQEKIQKEINDILDEMCFGKVRVEKSNPDSAKDKKDTK